MYEGCHRRFVFEHLTAWQQISTAASRLYSSVLPTPAWKDCCYVVRYFFRSDWHLKRTYRDSWYDLSSELSFRWNTLDYGHRGTIPVPGETLSNGWFNRWYGFRLFRIAFKVSFVSTPSASNSIQLLYRTLALGVKLSRLITASLQGSIWCTRALLRRFCGVLSQTLWHIINKSGRNRPDFNRPERNPDFVLSFQKRHCNNPPGGRSNVKFSRSLDGRWRWQWLLVFGTENSGNRDYVASLVKIFKPEHTKSVRTTAITVPCAEAAAR